MKKRIIVCFGLIVMLLLSAVAVHAAEREYSLDDVFFLFTDELRVAFDEFDVSTESKVTIKANRICSDLVMMAAAYKDNKLVRVEETKLSLKAGYNIVHTGIDWSELEKDKIKLMVWTTQAEPYAIYEYDVLRPVQSKLSIFEVTNIKSIWYDGEEAYRLEGLHQGEETVVILYNVMGYEDMAPEEFRVRDLLYISAPDVEGVISYAEKIDNIRKWEGIVYSTPFSDYAMNGYEADADAMMTLVGDDGERPFYYDYYEGELYKYYESLEEVDCSLVFDKVNALAGRKVNAYIGVDEDIKTGRRMVYGIDEKPYANKVTKISASQLVKDGDKYWDERGVVGYKDVGSATISTLTLDDEVSVVVNYGALGWCRIETTRDLAELFAGNGGSVEFISNDANSKIDVILVTVYAEDGEAVVEKVSTEDEMIVFDCYVGSIEDFDTEDKDVLAVVVKDGEVATIHDIAANDTVSIVDTDNNDSFIVYYVSSKTVTGAVESYDEDYVEIAGEEYELSPFSAYGSTADLSGKKGIFFLNVDGQIAHDEAERSAGNYAVILAVGSTMGINAGWEVEAVLADGTVATYRLDSKAFIKDIQDDKDDDRTAAELADVMVADGDGAWRVEADWLADSVYEITVADGKITKLVKLAIESQASGKEYDAENMAYGGISFSNETVIISVDADYMVEADDVEVGKVSDFMVDGEGEDAALYAFDEDNNDIAGLVVGFGLAATIPRNRDALVVTSNKVKVFNNDEAYVITGIQGGQTITYTVYDKDAEYTCDPAELSKGDVILTTVPNSEGIVKDIELLYDFDAFYGSELVAYDDIDSKKNEYYFAGMLDKEYEPTDSKFWLAGTGEEITMRNSANYTLVDLTESARNPEFSAGLKGKSIFGSLKIFDSEVFVRYYDDEIKEVVVYRTLSEYVDGNYFNSYKGIVTKTPLVQITENGEYDREAEYSLGLKTASGEKVLSSAEILESDLYLGKTVEVYVENEYLLAVEEKSCNKSIEITKEQLSENYSANGSIAYFEKGKTEETVLAVSEDVQIYVNYKKCSPSAISASAISELVGTEGKITFIDNNVDGVIDFILVTAYDSEAVIESVEYDYHEGMSFTCLKGNLEEVDFTESNAFIAAIVDGEPDCVECIDEYDTVSVVNLTEDGNNKIFYVSKEMVYGRAGEFNSSKNTVAVNGTEYGISKLSGIDSINTLSGDISTFIINDAGKIAYCCENECIDVPAVILAVGVANGINAGWEVEAVLPDGTVATYALSTKAFVKDEQETKDDDATAAYLVNAMVADGDGAWRVEADKLVDSVYEISVADGKITKLVRLYVETEAVGKDYDAENMAYGGVSFNDATIIISVDADAKVKADDVAVGTVSDFMVDGEGEDAELYAFDEDNNDIAGLVVGFGLAATIPRDGDALIVKSIKTREINNDNAYVITGLQGGQTVTYTVYDEDGEYTCDPADLSKGDVVLVATPDVNGFVKDIEMLYDFDFYRSELVACDDITSKKSEYYFAGMLDKDKEPTDSKFYLVDVEDEITMRNSANYTLVDFSESIKNPEFSKKTKGKNIFGSLTKYNSEVFVRYYDDELKEVVVYRTNTPRVDWYEEW